MDIHTFEILELPRVLQLLGDYAGSIPGRCRIEGLTPLPRPDADQRELRELTEGALLLFAEGQTLPRAAFDSPVELLRQAAPQGAVLEPDAFLSLRRLLATAHLVRDFLTGAAASPSPALQTFGRDLPDLGGLADRIDRVLDPDGQIRDHASPRLGEIRHELKRLERRVQRQLEQLLQDAGMAEAIQEAHVSIRNHRYVIPVRREFKNRMPGVVHDQSNSGRTLFMEPAIAIEAGNELAALRLEERDEILRILAELSDVVRLASTDIGFLFMRLTSYDAAQAVSSWAREYAAVYIDCGSELHLREARHPLLLAQFRAAGRSQELVPLDLELPPDVRALVVTGANAGGKTVALKTLGLLTLMAQCGLPVTADAGSGLRCFREVLADIGDEQSLQQNLSTFSSHLSRIREILERAAAVDALVLLDELGAGTDPVEGGALGCAILETLCQGEGLTLATTHLASVKYFVHEHPQMANASVMFNEETLEPEYVLKIGRPGASHAMTIARSIGIPEVVLDRAASLLDDEQLRLEAVLAQMDQAQRQLHVNVTEAQTARDRIVREREQLTRELEGLKKERKRRLHEAQQEAAAIIDNTRREMERLLRQAAPDDRRQSQELREKLQRQQQVLQEALEQTRPQPLKRVDPQALIVGQRVWVEVLRDHAVITYLSGDRKRAKVDVDGMVFDVKTRDLGEAQAPPAPETDPRQRPVGKPVHRGPVATELNLVGKRVEPALAELETFLDHAALAGLSQLRIIHGFGTGALREAVHACLKESPLVASFRTGADGKEPGGSGVTWVEL